MKAITNRQFFLTWKTPGDLAELGKIRADPIPDAKPPMAPGALGCENSFDVERRASIEVNPTIPLTVENALKSVA